MHSLIDPVFVDCIIFHLHPSTDSTSRFSRYMASRDAFGGFTFAAFKPKNIPAASMVMINPSLRESSMFFFQSKLLIYYIGSDLKHMTSFWWLILFVIDKFFIFRLKSVICKKYTNTNGKDRKYTNAIDISII